MRRAPCPELSSRFTSASTAYLTSAMALHLLVCSLTSFISQPLVIQGPVARTNAQPAKSYLQPSVRARLSVVNMMAGFGGGANRSQKSKRKPKPSGVTVKQSWEKFRQLRDSENVQTTTVFARLPDDDAKWLNVGGVIVEAPGDRQQAVNQNKRLILEHAARLHPKLALRSRELVCGFIETGDAPGEVVPLTKCEVPSDLQAGFQGLPDKTSGMYMIQGGIKGR